MEDYNKVGGTEIVTTFTTVHNLLSLFWALAYIWDPAYGFIRIQQTCELLIGVGVYGRKF